MDQQLAQKKSGFALVLVLAALVLILGITVGLLTLAGSERRASTLYADSSKALRQVDRVVDIVQSQINSATTEGTFAAPVSWASQPGMIRTFEGANPKNIYKLYSWAQMTRPATGFTSDTIPGNWAAQRSVFTDLNEPANGVYPILDPTVVANGISVPTDGSGNKTAPMPVQWLYVLEDGSLVTGVANGANADVAGANRAEKEIIARVAFWTDDETSKVNINTASEGLHWDVPRAEGGKERDMGRFQPVRYEVQRFPGHPAGVCLSEVFPEADFTLANGSAPRTSDDMQDRSGRVASLSPRVQHGGSLAAYGATSNPSTVTDPIVMGATSLAGTRKIDASADVDRLYATTDELLFSPTRTSQHGLIKTTSATAAAEIAERSFLVTAHSVAPETTLFETPKVSLWPIRASANLNAAPSKTNRADAYDKMLALSSSLPDAGGSRSKYYFQRENPLANNELAGIARNGELYDYLQTLTGKQAPGFSQSLEASWGAANRNSVLVQTFDMIRGGVNLLEGGLVQYSTDPTQVQSFAYPGPMDQSWNAMGPTGINANNFVGHVQSTLHDGAQGFGTVPFITRLGIGLYCEKLELLDAGGNAATGSTVTQLRYTLRPAVLVEAFSPLSPWGPSKQFRISARINSLTDLTITAVGTGAGTSGTWGAALSGNAALRGMQSINPAMDVGTAGTGYCSPHLFLVHPSSGGVATKNLPGLWGGNFTLTFPVPSTGSPAAPIGDVATLLDGINAGGPTTWGHQLQIAGGSLEVSLLDSSGNSYHSASVDFAPTPSLTVPHFGETATAAVRRSILITNTAHTAEYLFENRCKVASGLKAVQDGWIANDGDVVQGKEIASAGRFAGDFRLSALTANLTNADFEYPAGSSANQMRRHSFARGVDSRISLATGNAGRPILNEALPSKFAAGNTQQSVGSKLLRTLSSGVNGVGGAADYAIDISAGAIGALLPAPLEGGVGNPIAGGGDSRAGFRDSGFNLWRIGTGGLPNGDQTILTFSPNRLVFSSIQLSGGLLRQAASGTPWETLLYRANPSGTPDPVAALDHLYADLFWMPVVDPYPISETFSTAGKVNLNARLEPFASYIQRETALRAALKAIGIPVVDGNVETSTGAIRKYTFADTSNTGTPLWNSEMRDVGWTQALNLDQTLEGIRTYNGNDPNRPAGIFRSATEICRVPLVPDTATLANYDTFWSDTARKHTPDNLREQPYAHAYARLTTRSNAYTVHYRVQVLKKAPGTPDAQWVEGRDQVLSEYRGKSLIERYLDPNADFPDYATEPNPELMTRFYRWRTLSSTRFTP